MHEIGQQTVEAGENTVEDGDGGLTGHAIDCSEMAYIQFPPPGAPRYNLEETQRVNLNETQRFYAGDQLVISSLASITSNQGSSGSNLTHLSPEYSRDSNDSDFLRTFAPAKMEISAIMSNPPGAWNPYAPCLSLLAQAASKIDPNQAAPDSRLVVLCGGLAMQN